jgi:hypothetical protein
MSADLLSAISAYFQIDAKFICNICDNGSFFGFNVNGADYWVSVTKTGKMKKDSIRRAI